MHWLSKDERSKCGIPHGKRVRAVCFEIEFVVRTLVLKIADSQLPLRIPSNCKDIKMNTVAVSLVTVIWGEGG